MDRDNSLYDRVATRINEKYNVSLLTRADVRQAVLQKAYQAAPHFVAGVPSSEIWEEFMSLKNELKE